MSVPAAELTQKPPTSASSRPGAVLRAAALLTGPRFYFALAAVALVIGGLSLLIPSTPSYDPWSWIIWGREIVHLDLHTTGGPTWKPLPVIFTTLFAPFGKAAPDMWLVVGRAGAISAAVMVFKVAGRLTLWLSDALGADGETRSDRILRLLPAVFAGTIAIVGLVLSGAFIKDNALGYSEGLMTALVLIGVERHLDGHRRQAFVFGFFAALDRPEIWIFWGPYGLWLWWRDPGARKLVYAMFALIPVLWFGPELWGSGHLLRGVNRAQNPRANSPAFAHCPFCTEFNNAWVTVLSRIKVIAGVGVIAGTLLTARTIRDKHTSLKDPRTYALESKRDRARLTLAAAGLFGLAWWVVIAILTQAGFSGNNRYLVLGAAMIEVAGGVTWGWVAIELGRWLRRQAEGVAERAAGRISALSALTVAVLGFLLIPGFVGSSLVDISRTHRALVYQARLREDLSKLVSAYGGAAKLRACGQVMTEGFQVPMVAWTLDERTVQVQDQPTEYVTPQGVNTGHPSPFQTPPNVILQTSDTRSAALLPLPHDILYWEHQRHVDYQPAAGARFGVFRLFTACRR